MLPREFEPLADLVRGVRSSPVATAADNANSRSSVGILHELLQLHSAALNIVSHHRTNRNLLYLPNRPPESAESSSVTELRITPPD